MFFVVIFWLGRLRTTNLHKLVAIIVIGFLTFEGPQ